MSLARCFILHLSLPGPDSLSGAMQRDAPDIYLAISVIISTCRFLWVGFRNINNVATCIYTLNEAESLQVGASPLWPRKYGAIRSITIAPR